MAHSLPHTPLVLSFLKKCSTVRLKIVETYSNRSSFGQTVSLVLFFRLCKLPVTILFQAKKDEITHEILT